MFQRKNKVFAYPRFTLYEMNVQGYLNYMGCQHDAFTTKLLVVSVYYRRHFYEYTTVCKTFIPRGKHYNLFYDIESRRNLKP